MSDRAGEIWQRDGAVVIVVSSTCETEARHLWGYPFNVVSERWMHRVKVVAPGQAHARELLAVERWKEETAAPWEALHAMTRLA